MFSRPILFCITSWFLSVSPLWGWGLPKLPLVFQSPSACLPKQNIFVSVWIRILPSHCYRRTTAWTGVLIWGPQHGAMTFWAMGEASVQQGFWLAMRDLIGCAYLTVPPEYQDHHYVTEGKLQLPFCCWLPLLQQPFTVAVLSLRPPCCFRSPKAPTVSEKFGKPLG